MRENGKKTKGEYFVRWNKRGKGIRCSLGWNNRGRGIRLSEVKNKKRGDLGGLEGD